MTGVDLSSLTFSDDAGNGGSHYPDTGRRGHAVWTQRRRDSQNAAL